jgi:4-amino-4-deoxy-L-arabinose transferase-like glycosyltransferase
MTQSERHARLPSFAMPPSAAVLVLFVVAFCVPGLVGHAPWKTDDAIGIGVVHQMLQHDHWLLPHLAGEVFPDDGPLYYWLASALAFVCSGWFAGWLAPHDAARLASGLWIALTAFAIYRCAHLWISDPDSNNGSGLGTRRPGDRLAEHFQDDYTRQQRQHDLLALAHRDGSLGLLLFLGSLGLLLHAHEALPENASLAGLTLCWWGLSATATGNRSAPWLLGCGLAISLLAKGVLAVALPLLIVLLLPVLHQRWRSGRALSSLLAGVTLAALTGTLWLLALYKLEPGSYQAWWTHQQHLLASLQWPNAAHARNLLETLSWSCWPAWPVAGYWLWRRRHAWQADVTLILVVLLCSLLALLVNPAARTVEALILLPPLALAAGRGISLLRRGAANALSWFGVMTFAGLSGLIWFGWFAMMTGLPQRMAGNFTRLEPGFVPQFSLGASLLAALLTLLWAWVVLRCERTPQRSAALWASGVILFWGLTMTLWLPWIDYGKSYEGMAAELRRALPSDAGCVLGQQVGLAQRAAIDYHSGIMLRDRNNPANADCRWLVVQFRLGAERDPGAGWSRVWEGSRPRERERYRLYRKKTDGAARAATSQSDVLDRKEPVRP